MPTAVIGAATSLVGAFVGGSAAQGAASAQSQAAVATQQQAVTAAQPSFGQLQAINQQYTNSQNLLNTQLTQLQTQYSLYQSASSQAQALMSGQAASALAPVQQQQQLQRQQLQQQLESQYGPGYATTTAGSMALANFDMQTQLATSQIQGQYTSMYLGAASQLGAQYTQGLNSAYGMSANINQSGIEAANQLQNLKVGAITGTSNNVINTAGAPYAGAAYAGSALTKLGGTALGYGLGPSSRGGTAGSNNLWAGPSVLPSTGSFTGQAAS